MNWLSGHRDRAFGFVAKQARRCFVKDWVFSFATGITQSARPDLEISAGDVSTSSIPLDFASATASLSSELPIAANHTKDASVEVLATSGRVDWAALQVFETSALVHEHDLLLERASGPGTVPYGSRQVNAVNLQFDLFRHDVPHEFTPRLRPVELLGYACARLIEPRFTSPSATVTRWQASEFPLAISCTPQNHVFDPPRRERITRSLFEQQRPVRIPKLGPLIYPPTPTQEFVDDLHERLKWILTPPVDELLSDPEIVIPDSPYPFQMCGIKWLLDRRSALLADEMGLGKTMQAILAARLLWRQTSVKQLLVVCPKSLVPNWEAEFRKWWNPVSANIMICRQRREVRRFLALATPNAVVKIINYDLLVGEEPEWLKRDEAAHHLIILDEAQRIKNPDAKVSRAVKALKGTIKWAITGTPLENRTSDVVSIFDFVRPGLLKTDDPNIVRREIKPYILRRRTQDVLRDLPDKIDQNIFIDLAEDQRETYDRTEQDRVSQLNELGDTITITHVFQLITQLRQICNFDPRSRESAKLDRLLEDLDEIVASDHKTLVFSQFVDERSGIKRLKASLPKSYLALDLHGEHPPTERQGIVESFNKDPERRVLLLSYGVGGLGLNLQAANYVYLFDRWWNPAVEEQAVKRAHRVGQMKKVFVRRFVCRNTIEERILRTLNEKRRLFDHVIDENRPDESMGLTAEEMFRLFDIKVRPKRPTRTGGPKRLEFENLSPEQFEELISQIYERQGYRIERTGGSHDGGVDVFATKVTATGMDRLAIQCKRQKQNVGQPVLRDLWGVVNSDHAITQGVVATSSEFTSEAQAFASGKRLRLLDGKTIQRLAREFEVAEFVLPKRT
jgi:superfamily II DNA or RNA helicase